MAQQFNPDQSSASQQLPYQQPGYQQPGYQQPPYQQPGYQQPAKIKRRRKLWLFGIGTLVLLFIAGLLIHQASAALPSSWVADGSQNDDTSAGYADQAVYYLSWSNQNNYLTGSIQIVDYVTDAILHDHLDTDHITEQFTGTYNSQDQTVTLNINSYTDNHGSNVISETTTGHLSNNELALSCDRGEDYLLADSTLVNFQAASESEYNQDVQELPDGGGNS